MNIGDRVRETHGSEEGVIVKIKDKIVLVDIGDGFEIPFPMSTLTTIAKEEKHLRPDKDAPNTSTISRSSVVADRGIFIAFVKLNKQKLEMFLINNTDYDLPYVVNKKKENQQYVSLSCGMLQSRKFQSIEEVSLANFEQWPGYVFQFLHAHKNPHKSQDPLSFAIKFKANKLMKSTKVAPVLDKEAYTLQLDNLISQDKVTKTTDITSTQELSEKMFEKESADILPTKGYSKPKTIDLHIEKLEKNHANLSEDEMLQIQMAVFENQLDLAILSGAESITFIHGVGKRVLQKKIHQSVSGHPHVDYYKDAQKEKFGYGATLVKIK